MFVSEKNAFQRYKNHHWRSFGSISFLHYTNIGVIIDHFQKQYELLNMCRVLDKNVFRTRAQAFKNKFKAYSNKASFLTYCSKFLNLPVLNKMPRCLPMPSSSEIKCYFSKDVISKLSSEVITCLMSKLSEVL